MVSYNVDLVYRNVYGCCSDVVYKFVLWFGWCSGVGIEIVGSVAKAEQSAEPVVHAISKDETEVAPSIAGVAPPAHSIEDLIREAFPECPDTMLAIAKAESRLKSDAVNVNRNGTKDCGIFQINEVHGYDCEWLKNVDNNLKVAREVYLKQGLKAWVTYNYAVAHNLPI